MTTLYKELIVIELKFIGRNVMELTDYKYDPTVPLYYDDKIKTEQKKN